MAKEQPFRLEATYVPVSNRACERSAKTRSLAQQPACKNLDCIDQSPVITGKANTRRLLNAPIHALLKRARMPRNLHIRTSSLNGQRAAI